VTQAEFEALIADLTKRIEGTISWSQDKSGVVFDFRAKVKSDSGDQLSVKGSHNRKLGKTSYTLLRQTGFSVWTTTGTMVTPATFISMHGTLVGKSVLR
jgi:hypothetical protein